jgi:tetratricopeptide (TPR) repeat protein
LSVKLAETGGKMLTSGMNNSANRIRLLAGPPRLVALALALLTLLVYLPVCFHDFILFDDPAYMLDNHMVRAGLSWAGVKWAFVGWHASNWHPLTWLSHMLDCQLVGPNAGAQHFINVLFHAANVVALFYLWLRLTGKLWPSALVAALFAWHPLHVESVAWIAERKDVLSTLLGLLATLAYVKYAGNPKSEAPKSERNPKSEIRTRALGRGVTRTSAEPQETFFGFRASDFFRISDFGFRSSPYVWALICFALSLMAKSMLVTLPCVFLLLDYWPLGRMRAGGERLARLVAEKVPFFLLAGVICVITFLAQHGGEAVATLQDRSLGLRLENMVMGYAGYLLKSFWPVRLGILYPLPAQYPAGAVAAAAAGLAGITTGAWWWRRQCPWLLVGWLWFLGTLVPVIGLVQVGNQALADRYAYWPSIGLFAALVFGADWVAQRWSWQRQLALLGGLILCGSIALTERQLAFWQDTKTLFTHTLAVAGESGQAEMLLGLALERENNADEAIGHFAAAVKLDPGLVLKMPDGNHSLAAHVILLRAVAAETAGQAAQAIALYQQALGADPRLEEAHNNLANLLDDAGDTAGALAHYQAALELAPDLATPHENLGTFLLKLGQFDHALREYDLAARLAPGDPRPAYLTGKACLRHGQAAEAIAHLHQALELDPGDLQSLALLARILATDDQAANRDGRQAVTLAEKANTLAGGGQPFFLDVLAMTYAEAGRFAEARVAAGKALELATGNRLTNLAAGIRGHLQAYQAERPWREAFTNTLRAPQ